MSLAAADGRAAEAAKEATELRGRVEQLAAQANAAGSDVADLARQIPALEAEIEALEAQAGAERERCQRAAANAADLESLLRKERQSAVEAMELLSQAQDKFAGAFAAQ